MEYSYDLKRMDGKLYVSVEPLLKDIEKSVKYLVDMDTSSFTDEDKHQHDLKIAGLVTIHQFMHAFLQEEFLANKKLEGKVTLDTTTGKLI